MPLLPSQPLYVVTRRDLSWSQRVVQVAHAVGAHADDYGAPGVLVVFGVADELALRTALAAAPPYVQTAFYEPDLAGALTAFCTCDQPEGLHLL